MIEKIFIEKDDLIADVVEHLLEVGSDEVVLVIPKEARISESATNFRLLAREAEVHGKQVAVESVDDKARAFAEANDLKAIHPLFEGTEESRLFSDIVPRGRNESEHVQVKHGKKLPVSKANLRGKKKEKKAEETHVAEPQAQPQSEPLPESQKPQPYQWQENNSRVYSPAISQEVRVDESSVISEHEDESAGSGWNRGRYIKWGIIGGIALICIAVLLWGGGRMFGKASITLQFKKTPWEYTGSFLASVSEKQIDTLKNIIPAQLLESEKSVTQLFPASGKDQVSQKASGVITIYNAYSSAPQPLVATTRFVTPDGKVFRLDSGVTVPGAKIQDGKIISSSITARVTADKPGETYNVGKIDRLTIPGFSGSPRYEGFYGALEEGTKNGFVGVRAVPTATDIKDARARVEELLRAAFRTTFIDSVPEGLVIPTDATSFEIKKLVVDEATDEKGNFSVIGSASFRALAFRESDVKSILQLQAQKVYNNPEIRDLSMEYTGAVPRFGENATLSFVTKAGGLLLPALDTEEFKESILGKGQKDAASVIQGLRDLAGAKISFWPKWVRRVPAEADRVTIVVE